MVSLRSGKVRDLNGGIFGQSFEEKYHESVGTKRDQPDNPKEPKTFSVLLKSSFKNYCDQVTREARTFAA
jgi:hypothetical protein